MNSQRAELLTLLAELSQEDPELRLGQLIANLATLALGAKPEAVWDAEDENLLAAARRLLGHYHARKAKVVTWASNAGAIKTQRTPQTHLVFSWRRMHGPLGFRHAAPSRQRKSARSCVRWVPGGGISFRFFVSTGKSLGSEAAMSPWFFVLALIIALVVVAYAHLELHRHYQSLHARYQALVQSAGRPATTRHLSRRDISQQEYYGSLSRLGFQTLEEYRKSEQWRETKRRYRRSDYPQRCLVCGCSDFDLHHRSYARLGQELLFDLVPLCRRHHDDLHVLLDRNRELCVQDTHDYLVQLVEAKKGADAADQVPLKAPATTLSDGRHRDPGSPAKVKQRRSQAGKRWSTEEDAVLLRDFDHGMPLEELGARLHRGVKAVEVRLFKLGRLSLSGWKGPATPGIDHGEA
jgi:hypothetical protein